MNPKGSTVIGNVSIYVSSFCSSRFIIFNIELFSVSLSNFVLYSSRLNPSSTPANTFPELSFIDPLAAFVVVSLVSFISDVFLYSSP